MFYIGYQWSRFRARINYVSAIPTMKSLAVDC